VNKTNQIKLALRLADLHTATFLAVAQYLANVSHFEDNVLQTKAVRDSFESEALSARRKLVRRLNKLREVIEEFGPFNSASVEENAAGKALKKLYNGFLDDLTDGDADFTEARSTALRANAHGRAPAMGVDHA